MISHIVRRGLEHGSTLHVVKRTVSEGTSQAPIWASIIFFCTFVVFFVFVIGVAYSLHDLIPTLAMVETPSTPITVSAAQAEEGDKIDKAPLLEAGPAITRVHQEPITSSIRGTLRHLVSIAGRRARLRGLGLHLLYGFCANTIANVVVLFIPPFPGSIIVVAALAGAATANLHAAWTHKVISMPTARFLVLPPLSAWKVLAPAAAVATAMPYIALYITLGLASLLRLDRTDGEMTGAQACGYIARGLLLVVLSLACTLFICMPAMVTQIRIEASILPDDQDTIVPFDRSFGGKVESKLLGGTGCIGFLDAWRSFDREARIRLVKVYVKGFFVMTGLLVVFATVMVLQVIAFVGLSSLVSTPQ